MLSKTSEVFLATKDAVRNRVNEKQYVDVGSHAAEALGVSKGRLSLVVETLLDEGYKRFYIRAVQHGSGKTVTMKVLAVPESTFGQVVNNRTHIASVS